MIEHDKIQKITRLNLLIFQPDFVLGKLYDKKCKIKKNHSIYNFSPAITHDKLNRINKK